MKHWSIEKKILCGFLVAVFTLSAMGVVSYLTIIKYIHATQDTLRTESSLSEASSLLALNYTAESSHRAYLLTEDAVYLQQRNQAIQQVRAQLGELPTDIQQLSALAEERIRLLDEVLALQQQEGSAAVRRRLLQHPGKEQMSGFEAGINAIIAREHTRLAEQAALLEMQSLRVLGSFPVVLGVAVLFLFLLYRHIDRMIAERYQAEQRIEAHARALSDSEARVRAIVETAVDAIITIDEHGRIESANPATERMFGYAVDDLKGTNISRLMPPPFRQQHDHYIKRYIETGEQKIIGIGREVVAQNKNGDIFPVDLSVGEMQVSGKRMFAGMIRDISERKRAQDRQAQLLKEVSTANEELKSFAYVVSHDLKAPLRAIGSLSDWIASDNADKFDAEGQENMRLLLGRVRRMDRLIDGILEYSRVGRAQEVKSDIDLNKLLEDVLALLAPPPSVQVTVALLPVIHAEKTRIHQLFQNLIANAIQYTNKADAQIRVECVRDDNLWRFSISDNGPGIPQRHFQRIFQLFQTLTPKDKVESTGIGLALVKKIVEMYGGRIWVESKLGEGTTFFFTLPAVDSLKASER